MPDLPLCSFHLKMSPAAATATPLFKTPPQQRILIPNPLPNLYNGLLKKPISCSVLPTSKEFVEFVFVSLKSVRQKPMTRGSVEARVVGSGNGDEGSIHNAASAFEDEAFVDGDGVSNHQTAGGLQIFLSRLSECFIVATFGGLLLKHDGLAFWAALGSIVNVKLSTTLKKILNQERPVSTLSSSSGMPSSHAQTIFYTVVFIIFSVVERLGLSQLSAVLSGLVIALGSYFSWLRIALNYHTTIQVIVGAVLGSMFCVLWFWTWDAVVLKAYNSYLLVRVLVVSGAAFSCVALMSRLIRYWMKR